MNIKKKIFNIFFFKLCIIASAQLEQMTFQTRQFSVMQNFLMVLNVFLRYHLLPYQVAHSNLALPLSGRKNYLLVATNKWLLVQQNFTAKIIWRRIFQLILLNNSTLVIINNINENIYFYFLTEKRSGNIIYRNKS